MHEDDFNPVTIALITIATMVVVLSLIYGSYHFWTSLS
jgi:hypothetical protein